MCKRCGVPGTIAPPAAGSGSGGTQSHPAPRPSAPYRNTLVGMHCAHGLAEGMASLFMRYMRGLSVSCRTCVKFPTIQCARRLKHRGWHTSSKRQATAARQILSMHRAAFRIPGRRNVWTSRTTPSRAAPVVGPLASSDSITCSGRAPAADTTPFCSAMHCALSPYPANNISCTTLDTGGKAAGGGAPGGRV
eukprot:COSAG05_NODE_6944_length_876_cov_16.747692_2_plen_192_part_00